MLTKIRNGIKNEVGSNRFFAVLRNKNFWKLWISQIMSLLAVNIVYFALVIRVFQISGTNFVIGLLLVSIAIPSVIIAPVAGALADCKNRRTILLLTNFIQAGTILAYLFFTNNLGAICLIAFINAMIAQFYTPTEAAVLPSLVERKNLIAANSLFMFMVYIGCIVGYSMAGPIMLFVGNNAPFYLASAMLIIATVSVFFLPKRSDIEDKKFKDFSHAFQEIKKDIFNGFLYIKNNSSIYGPLLKIVAVLILLSIFTLLFPGFTKDELGIDVRGISHLIIFPGGIGLLIGSFLVERLERKIDKEKLYRLGIFCEGLVINLIASSVLINNFISKTLANFSYFKLGDLVELLPTVMIFSFLMGVFAAFVFVPPQTILQESVSDGNRGRVFATINMLQQSVAIPTLVIIGYLSDIFGPRKIMIFIGCVLCFYIFLIFFRGKSQFFKIKESEDF